jgi:hypothetical protein
MILKIDPGMKYNPKAINFTQQGPRKREKYIGQARSSVVHLKKEHRCPISERRCQR